MDRKTFLGTLVALPVGLFLVSCGSNSSGGSSNPNTPGAAPTKSGTQNIYTSSNVNSHIHTFSIDDTSFATPPAAGVSGDTSSNAGHTHSVSVSMAQLQQVATGQSVTVATSNVGNHTHVFTFTKIA